MARPNLAEGAARWSSQHRKKAILGWLAFVLGAAVVVVNLGIQEIPGEARRRRHGDG